MQPLFPPPPPPVFDMPRSSTEQTVTHELIFGTSIVFAAAVRGPIESARRGGAIASSPNPHRRRTARLSSPSIGARSSRPNLGRSLNVTVAVRMRVTQSARLTRAARRLCASTSLRPWDDRESIGRLQARFPAAPFDAAPAHGFKLTPATGEESFCAARLKIVPAPAADGGAEKEKRACLARRERRLPPPGK